MRRAFTGIDETLQLDRMPVSPRDPLFAFDAADERLVDHCHRAALLTPGLWILNDRFGALSLALARWAPRTILESVLVAHGIEHNGALNETPIRQIQCLNAPACPDEQTRLVVMRLPKSKHLLRAQLTALRPHLADGCVVVAGAMVKHLSHEMVKEFDRYIGPTTMTRAVKKARLIIAHWAQRTIMPPTMPSYEVPGLPTTMHGRAGVFGGGQLDAGAALLLTHLPSIPTHGTAIDLGCGDGVLGIALAHRSAELTIRFSDVSYRAIACAQENWVRQGFDGRQAQFVAEDCLEHAQPNSTELIVCNPPFHDEHVRSDATARRMFARARSILKPGGQLVVVGNRHLGYHVKLKRLFGHCKPIGQSAKFVVFMVTKA
ncbi:MAG: methyltransferase [Myxococcota bacterium]|nr:methyltransferase [Myxococcota bacterium]